MTKHLRTLILCIAAVTALFAVSAAPALAHHNDDHTAGPGSSEDRLDDDEKKRSGDRDGDADSDPATAQEDDHDSADDGDNAHPSGNDRSVENGGSRGQGKSESNPDDSKGPQRYEGAKGDDKSGGPGGNDVADQDGNNGCGNDDDFDDDNNGHCGSRVKPTPSPSPTPTPVQGTAVMTIQVDCFSVTVTSTKDISNVKVFFVDGTMEEINVNAPSFSKTFSKPIDFATSKSSTTTVIDVAPENCTQVSSNLCPAGTDMAGSPPGVHGCNLPKNEVCPAGTDMAGLPPSVFGCNLPPTAVCPAGTDMAGLPVDSVESCNDDDVLGNVLKRCPSGPFAGMPYMNEKDCDLVGGREDEVLPKVIRGNSGPSGVQGAVDTAVGAVGAVLPFTGAGDLYFAIALGMLLIAAGSIAMRLRRT